MTPQNILINTDLTPLELNIPNDESVVYDDETFLPRLLVKYEFFTSTSQIKKNRPDLWCQADIYNMKILKIGHKRVWIFVGTIKKEN